MKRLAIFDLDGTLLNTIDDLAAATNHALAALGYATHAVAEYKFFVGNGIDALFERALPLEARTPQNIAAMRSHFLPYYGEHLCVHTRPYDGIADLLALLQQRGVMMAVASNKYHEATCRLISHFFPHIAFTAVLGQREGIEKKPHPHIVHEIVTMAGVERDEVIYVGDSGVDMLTARNAGVESVGVTWGFRPEEELTRAGACHLAHNAAELRLRVMGE